MTEFNIAMNNRNANEVAKAIANNSFEDYRSELTNTISQVLIRPLGGIGGLTQSAGISSMKKSADNYGKYVKNWVYLVELLHGKLNLRNVDYGKLYAGIKKPNTEKYIIVRSVQLSNTLPAIEIINMFEVAGFKIKYIGSNKITSILYVFRDKN